MLTGGLAFALSLKPLAQSWILGLSRPREAAMMRRLWIGAAAMLLLNALVADAGVGGVAASPSTTIVKTAFNKKLKKTILVDAAGRTLYMFTSDISGNETICTPQGPYGAECLTIW